MKYGRLTVKIERLSLAPGAPPVFDVTLQNPMCPGNGRSMATRFVCSTGDLAALNAATRRSLLGNESSVVETAPAHETDAVDPEEDVR